MPTKIMKTLTVGGNTYEIVDESARTQISNKITAPLTAEVGQILVVKAVDENGRPTEWEAVDMAITQPDFGAPTLLGDVNGDGRVTIEDAQLFSDYMVGNCTDEEKALFEANIHNADVNGNGRLDPGDTSLILQLAQSQTVTMTEQEYEETLASGKVTSTTYYYIYEDVTEA